MADRTLTVTLVGDADQLNRTFRGVEESAGRLGGSLRRVGEIAGGFLAANVIGSGVNALRGFLGGAVDASSDLGESLNAVNQIFAEASDTIISWGEANATAFGLSQRQFNQMATPMGAILKNLGFSQDEAAESTINLTKRAADMASVFNTDVSDALEAINSALRGEANPIERYGVSVNAAAVQARALADTGKESAAALTEQEKAAARLAIIFEQTAAVEGDFASTSGELANAQRIAAAQTEELQAKIGEHLVPVMLQITRLKLALVSAVAEHLVPALASLSEWIGEHVVPVLQVMASWVGEHVLPVLAALGGWLLGVLVPAFQMLRERVVEELGKLTAYWESDLQPAVENIRRAFEFAIGAIVDFVAEHWPRIQRVVEPVLEQVRSTIETALEVIKRLIAVAVDIIQGDWSGAWENIRAAVTAVLTHVQETLDNILTFLREFGLLLFEAALDLGGKIIDGIVAGLKAGAGRVGDALNDIPGMGLVTGGIGAVGSGIGAVGGFLGFDTGGVVPGPVGSPQLAVVHGGETILPTHRQSFGAGTVINLTVNALDARGAADAVVDALVHLERSGRVQRITVGA